MQGEALEDALRDVKAEGRLVRAVRETGLTPLMELDVLASGGVAVSARTAEDEGGVGLASSRGCTGNVYCMQTCLGGSVAVGLIG